MMVRFATVGTHDPPMTPNQFIKALDLLRISQRELAPLLDCSPRLPNEWASGKQSIPPLVVEWLDACVAIEKANPHPKPPRNWRRPIGGGPGHKKRYRRRLIKP